MRDLVEPHLRRLPAYVPGLSIVAMQQKFGIENFVKLASNESAFGPSPLALEAATNALKNAHRYPNERRQELKGRICQYLNHPLVSPEQIILGSGSNEIITLLSRAFLAHDDVLLNAWPSFVVYRLSAAAMNRQEMTVPLTSDLHYDLEAMGRMAASPKGDRVKLVFLGNPNNPTGHYLSKQALSRFFERLPAHVVVVIDEAYFEYVDREDYASCLDWVAQRPRTVVLRTFSKIFGLAGMRIGFAVCDPEIAEILHRVRDPFNVSSVAQEAALLALSDVEHIKKGRDNNFSELPRVRAALQKEGHWVSDSVGNFVLFRLKDALPGVEVVLEELLKRGLIVRPLLNYDLTRYLRVTIGLPDENDAFLRAYSDISNRY